MPQIRPIIPEKPVKGPSLARTDVAPGTITREGVSISYKIKGVGKRTRVFLSGVVIEDDVVNKTKAYLYCLALRKTWTRGETLRRIRMDLTRSGIYA